MSSAALSWLSVIGGLAAILADLDAKPDGVLEAGRTASGSAAGCSRLPAEGHAPSIAGDGFADVWRALIAYGEVLFIIHTRDAVFAIKTPLPSEIGGSYFNIHGPTPLAGYLTGRSLDAGQLARFEDLRASSVRSAPK